MTSEASKDENGVILLLSDLDLEMQIHQENQADLGTLSVNMKRSPL
jgi:hypothetical protein